MPYKENDVEYEVIDASKSEHPTDVISNIYYSLYDPTGIRPKY